jgi:DNA-binding GntR family transcriptional regulator
MTQLINQLAGQIIELARAQGWPEGHHLREQHLADTFRVSRQPVRAALQLIARMGIAEQQPNRGFFLKRAADGLHGAPMTFESSEDEESYMAIAEDRLAGRLPDKVSETELVRRYRRTKGQMGRILSRMSREGWIERLPGHGWGFLPMLTSVESYEMAYRFRALIEPAALLEPGFKADAGALRRARQQQQALLDGDLLRLSMPQLFQINSEFHEMLAAFSGNAFILDALKRVNRLRRLIEYRKFHDAERLAGQCQEHLHVIDLVEKGERQEAAKFLRYHLTNVREIKMDSGIGVPPDAPPRSRTKPNKLNSD